MQIAAGFGLDTCDLNSEAVRRRRCRLSFVVWTALLIRMRIDAEERESVSDGAAGL